MCAGERWRGSIVCADCVNATYLTTRRRQSRPNKVEPGPGLEAHVGNRFPILTQAVRIAQGGGGPGGVGYAAGAQGCGPPGRVQVRGEGMWRGRKREGSAQSLLRALCARREASLLQQGMSEDGEGEDGQVYALCCSSQRQDWKRHRLACKH